MKNRSGSNPSIADTEVPQSYHCTRVEQHSLDNTSIDSIEYTTLIPAPFVIMLIISTSVQKPDAVFLSMLVGDRIGVKAVLTTVSALEDTAHFGKGYRQIKGPIGRPITVR